MKSPKFFINFKSEFNHQEGNIYPLQYVISHSLLPLLKKIATDHTRLTCSSPPNRTGRGGFFCFSGLPFEPKGRKVSFSFRSARNQTFFVLTPVEEKNGCKRTLFLQEVQFRARMRVLGHDGLRYDVETFAATWKGDGKKTSNQTPFEHLANGRFVCLNASIFVEEPNIKHMYAMSKSSLHNVKTQKKLLFFALPKNFRIWPFFYFFFLSSWIFYFS